MNYHDSKLKIYSHFLATAGRLQLSNLSYMQKALIDVLIVSTRVLV